MQEAVDTMDETGFPVAAIVAPRGVDPDTLLTGLAAQLAGRGLAVIGHVQAADQGDAMVLVDVACGAATGISQDLGTAARGCRLDSAALAGAVLLHESLSPVSWAGAALILAAIVIVQTGNFSRQPATPASPASKSG